MTPYPDTPMFSAIGEFQKDNGLKFDGFMNPGGETATAINKKLAQGQIANLPGPGAEKIPRAPINPGDRKLRGIKSPPFFPKLPKIEKLPPSRHPRKRSPTPRNPARCQGEKALLDRVSRELDEYQKGPKNVVRGTDIARRYQNALRRYFGCVHNKK